MAENERGHTSATFWTNFSINGGTSEFMLDRVYCQCFPIENKLFDDLYQNLQGSWKGSFLDVADQSNYQTCALFNLYFMLNRPVHMLDLCNFQFFS